MRYHDAPAAVEWLCKAFGFSPHLVVPDDGGGIAHAQLTLGNGMIMLGSVRPPEENDGLVKTPGEADTNTQAPYIVIEQIDDHYRQAVASGSSRVPRNIQLEHLSRVLDRGMKVIVRANGWREIESAIEFAEKWNLDLVIAGGNGAREIAGTLAEKNIPVILGPVQRLPQGEDTAYDDPNTLPGVLRDAGVEIAFATFNSSDARTLPYEAANSVSWGLSKEAALEAVTLGPARVLGVDDRLGSLEVGKVGNLIVTDGDPLEFTTRIEWVFIKGVPSDLDNKHDSLWEEYRNRPARRVTTTTT